MPKASKPKDTKTKKHTFESYSCAPESDVTVYESTRTKSGIRTIGWSTTTVDVPSHEKTVRKPNQIPLKPTVEDVVDFKAKKEAGKRKGKTQHDMTGDWLARQELYMEALLDQEAPPYIESLCCCGSGRPAYYICRNCHGNTSYCICCILEQHRQLPFHRIKGWNGSFLEDISLASQGLVTHFGHGGFACPSASTVSTLVTVHIDGFHHISVSFCQCESAEAQDIQLFRFKLFPASIHSPKSAFTFDVLEQYRLHHLEGKVSAYIYIQSLSRLTDDEGSPDLPDRLREFRRVTKQWDTLVTHKRAGRYGLHRLSQDLIFRCPTCPRPGINIDRNWYDILPSDKHWLVRLFFHFDANFRLVLARRENRDPGDRSLWSGPGFFVNSDIYRQYLKEAGEVPQEKSDCVNHRAVMLTTMSRTQRLEVTGIAGGVCRHECAIPNGFVDLHKGERYVNSDFAISNILKEVGPRQEVMLSYDIACQYSRNFHTRFSKLPQFLCATHVGIHWLVPKFHLPAHQQQCRLELSFNYTPKVGRTDGEAIERLWSGLNYLSGSTMRMTPLGRHYIINSHLNYLNWKKMCNMGATLVQRHALAMKLKSEHKVVYEGLKKSLSEAKVKEYTDLEEQYKPQKGVQSIYQVASEKVPTRDEILLRLAESEPQSRSLGSDDTSRSSAPLWVNDGIDIENLQDQLRVDIKSLGAKPTENQREEIHERRGDLTKTINEWKARAPGSVALDPQDDIDEQHPENAIIPLPSSTLMLDQDSALGSIERNLREAQAFDLLFLLRKSLAEKIALNRNQKRDQSGQKGKTRSCAVIKRVDNRINQIARRYRKTYDALKALGAIPHSQLLELKEDDISARNVFKFTDQVGKATDTNVSWIWRDIPIDTDAHGDTWLDEVLRVQFLEAKANLDRCEEECELVTAELGYTLKTFIYMMNHWVTRAGQNVTPGAAAHGLYMANVYGTMAGQIQEKITSIMEANEKEKEEEANEKETEEEANEEKLTGS